MAEFRNGPFVDYTVRGDMRGTKPKNNSEETSDATKPQRRMSPKKLVVELIKKAQTDLLNEKNKLSLADLVRLLQMEKEFKTAEATEIRFRWVKPDGDGEATGE